MFTKVSLCVASLLLPGIDAFQAVKRLENGVGITPALGWNNYNTGLSASADSALAAANAFIQLGLKDLGYTYVNLDDGWSTMARDSDGNLVPDPNKFPNGMKNVSDQIHALGLKFGLYGDSGTATCAGFPGSQGYEEQDAKLLASWGVDYWKYDNCNTPSGDSQPRYETMPASNAAITSYSAPGGFNDYDMLEIGNGKLTEAEERAHFGLWAICKSPLLLGTDLTKISDSSLVIVKNTDVIAINQDSLGRAASTFTPSGEAAPNNGKLHPYWSGSLSDGFVIALIGVDGAGTLSVSFADVPDLGAGTYSWTELYSGKTGKGDDVSWTFEVEHDMAIFKVTGKVPFNGGVSKHDGGGDSWPVGPVWRAGLLWAYCMREPLAPTTAHRVRTAPSPHARRTSAPLSSSPNNRLITHSYCFGTTRACLSSPLIALASRGPLNHSSDCLYGSLLQPYSAFSGLSAALKSTSLTISAATMGLIEKLQAKLELYRLEQRYTRRDKRTTFISDARYVDGEYVYGSNPSSPYSSTSSSTTSRRWSKMPTAAVREFTGRSGRA
ncbi:alpha-galactosidase [Botryosphaeria dothidea]|uniref:Alpha-galactosidase n=1 Tax=Botryosphaeria dothidea TaxID=55169 RepID=A0A8H4IJ21_9PEZI|nr:alpha-galactosidase [Botryosphaeria dothidea]